LHIHDAVRVPRASTAVLRTTSLLGEKFVELRPEGDPGQGPFFRNGDVVQKTAEAPELEFVADQLVSVLGGVPTTDLANIVNTGAVGFGGRGPELHALIGDLATISDSLASRTSQIGTVIDNLDRATQTLAGGAGDIKDLLSNLATTTGILSTDRDRAIHALDELSRLARVQNQVLDKYHGDIDRQIKQVDAIVSVASGQTAQLGTLVDFLDQFLTVVPKAIPADFNQVYMWLVPCAVDKRSPAGCP
jgi:phospholipid/cholesterol/gamma-HCH transport system substrate-binding protein